MALPRAAHINEQILRELSVEVRNVYFRHMCMKTDFIDIVRIQVCVLTLS